VIDSQAFVTIARRALGKQRLLYVNRLSSVILCLLQLDPSAIDVCCGFLFQLLPFIAETAVLSLFEFLCQPSSQNGEIHEWLVDHAFVEVFVQQMMIRDFDADHLVSCLRLIPICAANPVFEELIFSPQVVSSLNLEIVGIPISRCIEDCRWTALAAVYGVNTVEEIRGYLPPALQLVTTDVKGPACCAALRLLQRMLELDEIVCPFMIEKGLPTVVMDLIVGNPDHSILHQACRLLIVALAENKETRSVTIAECARRIAEAASGTNRNLTASMFELVRDLMKSVAFKDLKAVPEFCDVIKKTKENTDLMNAGYGGSVRKSPTSW
jgi:hypothetical protein